MKKEQSRTIRNELSSNTKKLLIFALFTILTIALSVSYVLAAPIFLGTPTTNDTDIFYRNLDNITVIINATADTLEQVNVTIFCSQVGGTDVNIININGTLNTTRCVVDTASPAIASNPDVQAQLSQGGFASINISVNATNGTIVNATIIPIVVYNMTTPPSPPNGTGFNGCTPTRFGSLTTNFQTVSDFAHTNFVVNIQANFTCLSEGRIDDSAVGFRDVMVLNLTSVNLSTVDQARKLRLLQSAMDVRLVAPHKHGNARIYINQTAFSEIDTNATIKFFYLPFTRLPAIFADNPTHLNSSGFISNGYDSALQISTVNLTINVTGFDGYNATDNETPIITVNSPTGAFNSTTFIINVTVNGTVTEPSAITINYNGTKYVYNSTTFPNITNTAGCTAAANGSELFNCIIPGGATAGAYTLNITAYDYGGQNLNGPGNTATSNTTFVIDTTKPIVRILTPSNGAILRTSTPIINFTINDSLGASSGFANVNLSSLSVTTGSYTLTSSNFTCNESSSGFYTCNMTNGPTLSDGTNNVTISVKDNATNSANTSLVSIFTIDNTAPTVTLISPANNSKTNSSTVTFVFNVTDTASAPTELHCNLYIDDAINFTINISNPSTNTSTFSGIADGLHNWSVDCLDYTTTLDEQGNTNYIMVTGFFTVDIHVPVITVVSPTATVTTASQLFNISLNDTFSTVTVAGINTTSIGVTLSGATNLTYTSQNMTFTEATAGGKLYYANFTRTLGEGLTVYTISVSDNASNAATTVTGNITLESAGPTPVLSGLTQGYNYSATTWPGTFNVTFTDGSGVNISTINVSVDGMWFWNGTTNLTCSGTTTALCVMVLPAASLTDAANIMINTTAKDNLGNQNLSKPLLTFTYDSTAPYGTFSYPAADTYLAGSEFINGTLGDATTTVYTVQLNISNSTNQQVGSLLTVTAKAASHWNYTLNTTALSDGVYNITSIINDTAGNVNKTQVREFNIDNTPPTLNNATIFIYDGNAWQPLINATSAATAINLTNVDGNITINWTITETNFYLKNLSIDSGVITNVSNVAASNRAVIGLDAGLHTIVFNAEDKANSTISSPTTYYFKINAQENTTNILATLNVSTGPQVNSITLATTAGVDLSNNLTFLNGTYDMTLNSTTTSGTTIPVKIEDFSGQDANWNKTFTVNTTDTNVNNTLKTTKGAAAYDMVIFTSMSNFLPSGSYFANITYPYNVDTLGLYVWFIENDAASTITPVSGASCTPSINMTTACYVASGNTTTIYLPHFSGVAVTNDTIAPQLSVTYPVNNTNYTYSYNINITGSVNESNSTSDMCKYAVDGEPNTTITLNGTSPAFTFSVNYTASVLTNGYHNITINCTDGKGNTIYRRYAINMSDSTAPVITTPSASVTSTGATITFTPGEPANYSLSYGTTSTLGSAGGSSSTKSVDSKSISLDSLTASTTYYYNVTTCDTNANCVINGTYSFTTSAAATTTTESSSGGGGGASTNKSSILGGSTSHSWDAINPGSPVTMTINRADIPITKLVISVGTKVTNVDVTVGELTAAPTDDVPTNAVYKYTEIQKTGMTDEDIATADITFKVEKSWLTENGLTEDDVVLMGYDGGWKEIAVTKLSSDADNVYYKGTAQKLGYLAITTKIAAKGEVVREAINETAEVAAPTGKVTQPTEEATPPAQKITTAKSNKQLIGWMIALAILVAGTAIFFIMRKRKI